MSEQLQDNRNLIDDGVIVAGGNVFFGDNTGQLAIGKYINQVMIKEPSGQALVELMIHLEQKRKEAANLEILNSYNSSALPYLDLRVKEFVTTNRVEELNKALIYLQDHRILLFTGIGGVGKTTLAKSLVEVRPANVPLPFWFDFRMNQSAKLGDILEKLASYMNCPDLAKFREEKREAEKKDIDKLTDKLQAGNPVWLIFDNLETILDDIYFHDEYIDLLFACLRNNTHQTKIIVTSRVFPKLKNGEDLIDVIEGDRQDVKGLKINFAVDYLVKNGLGDLEPNKLEELATGVDGHPLALQLLVGLVKDYGAHDILNDLSIYQEEKDDIIKKSKKLFDKLAGDEKELLERISVYREPVKLKGLKEMFIENTSKNAVMKLRDKSLLETDHQSNYWLHPLVQEFSYEDLKNKKEAHLIAFNYYKSQDLLENPTKKEDLQPAIEAHYHACEAGEYDLAVDIIGKFNLHNLLDLWGYPKTLIEIYEKLLPNDHFKGEPILKDKRIHGSILGNLGIAYCVLGDAKKSINYYEQALKIAREIGDKCNEGGWLGDLGNSYRNLGNAKKAIEYYEQALLITRKIGDKRNEGATLGSLGNAYCMLGDTRKSIDYYKQALKIARGIGNRRDEGIWLGNMGLAYSDLGDVQKSIDYYEQALIITKEIGDRRGEGTHLGNLGLEYHVLGDDKKSIDYCEQALIIASEIGDRRGEGNYIVNLGSAYYSLGDAKKAIEYYEQALIIAREIGDRQGEGTALGSLGLAYSIGETKKAIDYYEQALIIAREIGDRRREKVWLVNMGNSYYSLGDAKKSIYYNEQVLKIAREIGNRREEGNILGNMGFAYSALGETEKAIDYCEQALIIAKEISDRRNEGIILGNLGREYKILGEPKKAIECCEQSLKIAKEIGDRRGESTALRNLGNAYYSLGDVKKSIYHNEQVLKIAREIGDRREEGNILENLGFVYGSLGETEKSIYYYEQALIIAKEISDRRNEGNILGNLGRGYKILGEPKKAIECCEQSLKITREIGDRREEGHCLMILGWIYSDLGEPKKTIEFLKESFTIGKLIEDPSIISFCEQILKELEGFNE
jgi:tetratricopeptide (TPR) repeat protein